MLAERVEEERGSTERVKLTARFIVTESGKAAGRAVRDVLWPTGARIVRVDRGEENYVPDGNSVLLAGDLLTITGETADEEVYIGALTELIGEKIDE